MPPPPVVRKPRLTHIQTDSAIEKLLLRMLEMGASDLHLASNALPAVRLHGSIEMLTDAPKMSDDDVKQATALGEEMGKCMMKAMGTGTTP